MTAPDVPGTIHDPSELSHTCRARLRELDDRLLADIPRYSLSAVRKNPMFVDPKLVEELIDSLRLAGLPE